MDLLVEVLGNLTRENKVVIIPDWGILVKKPGDLPGLYFNEYVTFDDGKFAEAIAKASGSDKDAAYNEIRQFVALTKRRLDLGESVEVEGIGVFKRRPDLKISFDHKSSAEYAQYLAGKAAAANSPGNAPNVDPIVRAEKEQREQELYRRLQDEARLEAQQKAQEEQTRRRVAEQMRVEEEASRTAALQQRFREVAAQREEKQRLAREKFRLEMQDRMREVEDRAKRDHEAAQQSLQGRLASEKQRIEDFQNRKKAERRGEKPAEDIAAAAAIDAVPVAPSTDILVVETQATPVTPQTPVTVVPPTSTKAEVVTEVPVSKQDPTAPAETSTAEKAHGPEPIQPKEVAKTPEPAPKKGRKGKNLDLFEAASLAESIQTEATKEPTSAAETPVVTPSSVETPSTPTESEIAQKKAADSKKEQEEKDRIIAASLAAPPIIEAPKPATPDPTPALETPKPTAPAAPPASAEQSPKSVPAAPPAQPPIAAPAVTPAVPIQPKVQTPIPVAAPTPVSRPAEPTAAAAKAAPANAAITAEEAPSKKTWFDEDEEFGYVKLVDPVKERSRKLLNYILVAAGILLLIAGGLFATMWLMESGEKTGKPLFVEEGSESEATQGDEQEKSKTGVTDFKKTTEQKEEPIKKNAKLLGIEGELGKALVWSEERQIAHRKVMINVKTLPRPDAFEDYIEDNFIAQAQPDQTTDNSDPYVEEKWVAEPEPDKPAGELSASEKKAAAAKKKKEEQEEKAYQDAIQSGDLSFNAKQWESAKSSYNRALEKKPSSTYAKQQLSKIVKEAAKDEKNQQAETAYRKVLADADQAFANKDFTAAKTAYIKAGKMRPTETYPTEKIKAVDQAVAQAKVEQEAKQKEQAYKDAIQKGDQFAGEKNWQKARIAYHQAASLKPKEAYPKKRLTMVDQAELTHSIDQKRIEKENKYKAALALADQEFTNKSWAVARAGYGNALAVFPGLEYPTSQIRLIDKAVEAEKQAKLRAEEDARQTKLYNENVVKADAAYKTKSWDQAKLYYAKAQEAKPQEPYASNQLQKVNGEIAREEALYREAHSLAVKQAAAGEKPNIEEARRLLETKEQAFRNAATRQETAVVTSPASSRPGVTAEQQRLIDERERALRAAATRPAPTPPVVTPDEEARRIEEEKARALRARIVTSAEVEQQTANNSSHYIVVSCCTTDAATQSLFSTMERDGYQPKVAGSSSTYIMSMRPYLDKGLATAEAAKMQTKYGKTTWILSK